MEDITTNGGKVYTDAEYLSLVSGGTDKLVPEFIPTQNDLRSLALQLVGEASADYYYASLCAGRGPSQEANYKYYRLDRLWEFLPKSVQEEIDLELEKAEKQIEADLGPLAEELPF